MSWLWPVLAVAIGYLLGSIPFGLLLTRLGGAQDPRSIGSGNIGATNVLRTGHKGLAAATLLGDALKGSVAVWIFAALGGLEASLLAGFAAVLGHAFPVWLKFKGGKGVATFIGTLLAVSWVGALTFGIVWLAAAVLTRYASLASILGSAVAPVALWLHGEAKAALAFAVLAALLWYLHRANISRLLAGNENRIGAKG